MQKHLLKNKSVNGSCWGFSLLLMSDPFVDAVVVMVDDDQNYYVHLAENENVNDIN